MLFKCAKLFITSFCCENHELNKIVHVHVLVLHLFTVIQLTLTFVSKEPEATNSP